MDALPQLHLHDMQSVNATDAARSQHGLFANQSSKNEPKSSDSTALADGWRGSSIDDASTIAASSPEPLISAELPGNEDYGSSSSDGKRESGGINSVIQNTEPALARNTTYQKPGADPPIPIQASSGTRSKPSLSERRSQPGVPSVIDVLVPDPDALKSIWCTYAREAHAFDQRMIESWNKTLDVRLIFAALFSAILTPFLVESCKLLETRPSPNIFGREGYKVRMNAMWFGSLIFALTAALLCIHCKQWLDGYGVDLVFAGAASGCPESLAKACRLRQYRYQGLHIYKIPSIIDTLPALLYIALSCFVIGLIDFLWQLNEAIAIYISCLCGLVVTFYVGTTLSPCLTTASPYKTPVSRFIGNLVRTAKGGERLEDQEVKDVRDLEESLNESGFQWLMNYSRNEDVHGQAKRAQKEHRRVMGIKHETVAN